MSDKPQAAEAVTCRGQESINWKQCMLCQSEADKKELVQHPRTDSYQRVLDVVEERASVHDGNYVEVQRRLQSCTKNTLCAHQPVYHRSCYATTNKDQIQRAQDLHSHALATGHHTPKKRGQKRGSALKRTNQVHQHLALQHHSRGPVQVHWIRNNVYSVRKMIMSSSITLENLLKKMLKTIQTFREYYIKCLNFIDKLENDEPVGLECPKKPKEDLGALLGKTKKAPPSGEQLHDYLVKDLVQNPNHFSMIVKVSQVSEIHHANLNQVKHCLKTGYHRLQKHHSCTISNSHNLCVIKRVAV